MHAPNTRNPDLTPEQHAAIERDVAQTCGGRSLEFIEGFRNTLAHRFTRNYTPLPYRPGTREAGDYLSGRNLAQDYFASGADRLLA